MSLAPTTERDAPPSPTARDELYAISAIVPAFGEARTIGQVVAGIRQSLETFGHSYEVIVVDDGSTDGTADLAEAAGARVVRHPYNLGYGASLKTGIRAACGTTVVMLDADGQHDPQDIPLLLAERRRYDMVVGVRGGGKHSPLWRRPGKAALGWLAERLTGRRIPDLNCGFRALERRMALRLLPILPNGFSLSTTITIAAFRAGYTVGYVPIHAAPRIGSSTVKLSDGFNTLMLMLRIISLFAPLNIFLPVAGLCLVVGFAFIAMSYLASETASIRGILMIIASIMLFLFGLLADQIAALRRGERVHDE